MYVLFNFPTLAAACTSCIVNTKLISATQSPNSSWLPRPQQVQDASEEQYGSKHLRIHPQQKSFGLEIPLSTLWGNSSWNWQPPSYRPPVVSCHMIYTVRSLPKYTGDFHLATPLDVDRNNKQLKVHRKVQGHWEQDKTCALTCCRHSWLTCNGPAYPPWRFLYTFLQFAILGYLQHTISCDVSWSFTNTLA